MPIAASLCVLLSAIGCQLRYGWRLEGSRRRTKSLCLSSLSLSGLGLLLLTDRSTETDQTPKAVVNRGRSRGRNGWMDSGLESGSSGGEGMQKQWYLLWKERDRRLMRLKQNDWIRRTDGRFPPLGYRLATQQLMLTYLHASFANC